MLAVITVRDESVAVIGWIDAWARDGKGDTGQSEVQSA